MHEKNATANSIGVVAWIAVVGGVLSFLMALGLHEYNPLVAFYAVYVGIGLISLAITLGIVSAIIGGVHESLRQHAAQLSGVARAGADN